MTGTKDDGTSGAHDGGMTGAHDGGPTSTDHTDHGGTAPTHKGDWPLYEVFVRGKRGLNHVHVGSLHAADDRMALTHARDLYTRRNEGVSLWVVRSEHITASTRDEKDPFFEPSADKVYRHPTFYDIPDDVPHI